MFRKLCGERTLKNVTIMTNMWGRVAPEEGEDREQQLKDEYFRAAIENGAQLRRHDDTPESARAILRTVLNNTPAVLEIQRELIDDRKGIEQTGAGEELRGEMSRTLVKYQREIKELEKDVQGAMEEEDEGAREELEEEKRKLQEEMKELWKAMMEMKSTFEAARLEMEERISARFEEQLKRLREDYEAEIRGYKQKMEELERKSSKWSCAIM